MTTVNNNLVYFKSRKVLINMLKVTYVEFGTQALGFHFEEQQPIFVFDNVEIADFKSNYLGLPEDK